MAARQRAGHRVEERVHRLGDVLLRQTGALRNLVHDIGFGHLTPPAGPTGRPWKPLVKRQASNRAKNLSISFWTRSCAIRSRSAGWRRLRGPPDGGLPRSDGPRNGARAPAAEGS